MVGREWNRMVGMKTTPHIGWFDWETIQEKKKIESGRKNGFLFVFVCFVFYEWCVLQKEIMTEKPIFVLPIGVGFKACKTSHFSFHGNLKAANIFLSFEVSPSSNYAWSYLIMVSGTIWNGLILLFIGVCHSEII